MYEKSTEELNHVLKSTHVDEIEDYLTEYEDEVLAEDRPFSAYMRAMFKEKRIAQQDVFLEADVPERYGYKLISGEKRTKQRDVILRICYAAHMSIDETQRALKIYHMPELYARIPRDAVLMVVFNDRPGNITDVNELLMIKGLEPLKSSGAQE